MFHIHESTSSVNDGHTHQSSNFWCSDSVFTTEYIAVHHIPVRQSLQAATVLPCNCYCFSFSFLLHPTMVTFQLGLGFHQARSGPLLFRAQHLVVRVISVCKILVYISHNRKPPNPDSGIPILPFSPSFLLSFSHWVVTCIVWDHHPRGSGSAAGRGVELPRSGRRDRVCMDSGWEDGRREGKGRGDEGTGSRDSFQHIHRRRRVSRGEGRDYCACMIWGREGGAGACIYAFLLFSLLFFVGLFFLCFLFWGFTYRLSALGSRFAVLGSRFFLAAGCFHLRSHAPGSSIVIFNIRCRGEFSRVGLVRTVSARAQGQGPRARARARARAKEGLS